MTLGTDGRRRGLRATSGSRTTCWSRRTATSSSPRVTPRRAGSNARILKFDRDRQASSRTWGKFGTGPGEMDQPHALAMDSQGRLFVGDRGQRPHPDLRPGRQAARYLVPVQPAERASHRPATTSSTPRTPSRARSRRRGRAGSAASASAARATAGSRLSFRIRTRARRARAPPRAWRWISNGVIYGAEVGPRALKRYVRQ